LFHADFNRDFNHGFNHDFLHRRTPLLGMVHLDLSIKFTGQGYEVKFHDHCRKNFRSGEQKSESGIRKTSDGALWAAMAARG